MTVVGIGADGWAGLAPAARGALAGARVLLGARRQLDLLPDQVDGRPVGQRRVRWPSPLLPALAGLLAEHGADAGGVCVLASGDPMFFGIGTTLVRLLGAARVWVLPHPSSVSLACARLGWAVEDVEVVSAVGRPLAQARAVLAPRRRLLVLSAGRTTPGELADLLVDAGYGSSGVTVLDRLGAADESRQVADAADWAAAHAAWPAARSSAGPAGPSQGQEPVTSPGGPAGPVSVGRAGAALRQPSDLTIVAVDCRLDPGVTYLPRTPGLPDDAFEHDGQLTKREIRALTVARLAPAPGELLWDVGAGSGSVAIEWMRTHPSCRALAIEPQADRAARIRRNAVVLGVPSLQVIEGRAPGVLDGLPTPDAIFVGGGVSAEGVLDACWAALLGSDRPVGDRLGGGRLVANAVTLQAEAVLAAWYGRYGGELVRLSVSRAAPVGRFTGWRPAMPVTQWAGRPADSARLGGG